MRYFYTDPLAAAWMARHFGMKFDLVFTPTDDEVENILAQMRHYSYAKQMRYFIKEYSLHLLEPKENDILKNTLGYPVLIRTNGFASLPLVEVPEVFQPNETVIIQRNNIPFMWPESENV